MSNPIFQQNQPTNLIDFIRKKAQQNPAYTPIVQMLENGVSPEKVFRDMCAQRGINPDQFLAGLNK